MGHKNITNSCSGLSKAGPLTKDERFYGKNGVYASILKLEDGPKELEDFLPITIKLLKPPEAPDGSDKTW